MDLGWYILIIGLTLLIFGEIKQRLKLKTIRSTEIGKNVDREEDHLEIYDLIRGDNCQSYSCLPGFIIILVILITSIILTWIAFKVFPTTIEPQKIVTVLAGIFGIFSGSIGLFKLLK